MMTGQTGPSRSIVLREERAKVLSIYAITLIATGILFFAATIVGRASPILDGLGIVAYVLGLRHGVDVDHIAAIDNTTRKLIQQGKPSSLVGTWFSLGHSTVVVGFVAVLVLLTRSVTSRIPTIQAFGSVIGLVTSGTFLVIIGLLNLYIVLGIYRLFKRARSGDIDEKQMDDFLGKRGVLNRLFSRLFNLVGEAWQIYPIGILFGLGFDTATEIGLIAISVGIGVSSSVPVWQIMILPLLFTCGMVLTDTTDGLAMRMAYGWALYNPLKKMFYNLTISVMSVIVAFGIGGIELLQIIALKLNYSSFFWDWLKKLNFETMGLFIILIFLVTWAVGYVFWKIGKYDNVTNRMKNSAGNSKR